MSEQNIIEGEYKEFEINEVDKLEKLENSIITELPNVFTIANIAEICECKQTTIRNIVQLMEKEGILSTSNKEANSHRKLNVNDFDAIRHALELVNVENLTYSSAISKIANERKTGIEPSIKQIYEQSTRTILKQEKLTEMAAKLIEVVQEQAKMNTELKDELDQTRELLSQATECIQKQNESIKSLSESTNTEIKEFIIQHNSDIDELKNMIKPEKKKKIFGIF